MLCSAYGRTVLRRINLLYTSRCLSTASNQTRYGFVGLGQMGYPMALNLLRKTTPESSFTIYDVNPLSLSRFVNEAAALPNAPHVTVAKTPKDLAEQSVNPNAANPVDGRTTS
jgi:NAD binding domain of 6-phosphogluconate dehydrogenase